MVTLVVLVIFAVLLWWAWPRIPQPLALIIGALLGLIIIVFLLHVLGVGPGLPGFRLR